MAKKKSNKTAQYIPKKTSQGTGKYTRTPHAGGERFLQGVRSGSPPSKARRNKKPYRGQGH